MTTTTDAPAVTATDDRAGTTATLLAAFTADPLLRWMFPEAGRYMGKTVGDVPELTSRTTEKPKRS